MYKKIVNKEHNAKNSITPDIKKITKEEHLDNSKEEKPSFLSKIFKSNK